MFRACFTTRLDPWGHARPGVRSLPPRCPIRGGVFFICECKLFLEFQKNGETFFSFFYFSRKNLGGIFSQRTGPSPGQVRLSARAPPLPSGGGRRINSDFFYIFKKIEISEMFCLFFPGDGTFSSLGDSTPPPSPPECGWVHVAPPAGIALLAG